MQRDSPNVIPTKAPNFGPEAPVHPYAALAVEDYLRLG
jgi:hypothetical protein